MYVPNSSCKYAYNVYLDHTTLRRGGQQSDVMTYSFKTHNVTIVTGKLELPELVHDYV